MLIYVYLIKDLCDLSSFVDEERFPIRAHILLPVHAFFAPDAIAFDDRLVGVGNQIELKTVLGTKLLMSLLVIDRNAEQLDILFFEFVVRITERARFLRSARCVVFRVEEKYDALAFEIRKLHRISVLIFRSKIWSFIAFFEHNPPGTVRLIVCDCSMT